MSKPISIALPNNIWWLVANHGLRGPAFFLGTFFLFVRSRKFCYPMPRVILLCTQYLLWYDV